MLINKNHLSLFKTDSDVLVESLLFSFMTTKSERESKGATVFLSHKHNEKDILRNAVSLLRKLGVTVYLDWEDNEMPPETCGETAEKIKRKIIENQKFILLATNDAINSRWCTWELGFGDSHKYHKDMAIMPITEDDGDWIGMEYLQIYPIIKTDNQTIKGNYYVEFKGEKTKFAEWLKK